VSAPRWLTPAVVRALHGEAIARFGGASGLRDEGLLESALARPRQLLAYGDDPDLFAPAAACAAGILRSHPFVDGNKRAAVLAVAVFLHLNGWRFDPEEADEVRVIRRAAAGEIDEPTLAAWIKANSAPRLPTSGS